ncbi:MAG: polysaccharide biosynthesis C-terminal domain-containing protein, partial [Actinomycetota bacterium]|nr:polysaccharide biosynthesis C-terminal domain-containing protein [Actinomycetota bacterium]
LWPTARVSGWFLVRDLARAVIHRVDIVVVGVVLGVEEAAAYAVAAKLVTLARRLISSLARLYFPFASSLSAADDRPALSFLALDGSRTALVVGLPMTLVLTALASPIIEAWVGPGYGDAATVLVILASAQAVFAVTETWWGLLMGSGHVRVVATVAIAEAVLNLGTSVVFAHVLGLAGVALGTLLAVALFELPVALVLVSRHTGVPRRAVWSQVLRPHLAPGLLAGAFLALAAGVVPSQAVAVLVIAAAGGVLYLLAYVLLSATESERARLASLRSTLLGRRSKHPTKRSGDVEGVAGGRNARLPARDALEE